MTVSPTLNANHSSVRRANRRRGSLHSVFTAGIAVIALLASVLATGAGSAYAATTPAGPVVPLISTSRDVVVSENAKFVDLTVSLSAPSTLPVTVYASHANSTALNSSDYIYSAGYLTFAPGETTKTVRTQILDDKIAEPFETFLFNISYVTNATIARPTTVVSIVDNDTIVASPKVFVRDAIVDESAGTVSVPVVFGSPNGEATNSAVSVAYTTSNDTATASDYTPTNGTLTFAAGDTVKNIIVPITNDTTTEIAERFNVQLSTPNGVTLGDSTGIATIGSNDANPAALPLISTQADPTMNEGDNYIDLTVSLSAPSTLPVTVYASHANSTALNSSDYIYSAGYLTFAPGETTKTVRTQILDDKIAEPFETFLFNISYVTNATIARPTTVVSIVDNDTIVASPKVFVRDAIVDESAGTVSVPVVFGSPNGEATNSAVSVAYTTSNDTATASDYTPTNGTLTFAAGDTVKNIIVPITNDTTTEIAERFNVQLSTPNGVTLGDSTGIVTIGSNDANPAALPLISTQADPTMNEGDNYIDLTVSLSAPSTLPVTVYASHANSTALNSSDYIYSAGYLTFAPGETTKTIRTQILDDKIAEPFKTFLFNISYVTNATIARPTTVVSIVDND